MAWGQSGVWMGWVRGVEGVKHSIVRGLLVVGRVLLVVVGRDRSGGRVRRWGFEDR